ncbi:MAG: DUF3288 family protein [Prochlorococcus sp.]|nr:DUF3288 family protein [Prochlorococcus sp.]CAI8161772.1 MAG: Uncharacterised protein [Prochlorococcus marinus str. MIT 9215]
MSDSHLNQEQNHPLYATDRDHIDRLLAKELPADADVVDLARLMLRYEGFPGASDLQADMVKTLKFWGLTREALNVRARQIWNQGFRPGQAAEESVGSGFDNADGERN